jgi:hypothetical protein
MEGGRGRNARFHAPASLPPSVSHLGPRCACGPPKCPSRGRAAWIPGHHHPSVCCDRRLSFGEEATREGGREEGRESRGRFLNSILRPSFFRFIQQDYSIQPEWVRWLLPSKCTYLPLPPFPLTHSLTRLYLSSLPPSLPPSSPNQHLPPGFWYHHCASRLCNHAPLCV